MIYALRNRATGKLMADKYRMETDDPHEACFYSSERNAKLSVSRRKRTHKNWEPRAPGRYPHDFEIVPLRVVLA